MNLRRACICILFMTACVQNQHVHAQAIRLQQPIVQQFSAGTTVSVPDRGSVILGGFHSGATRSKQVGPFRRGNSYGQAFQSSTSSVGVYIHDFEAMDRLLLNSAPLSSGTRRGLYQSGPAHWKQQLLSQQARTPGSKHDFSSRAPLTNPASLPQEKTQSKAERFFELGQSAEEKHATPNIAILHYRMAVKHGSTKAQARLQKLTPLKQKK